MMKKLKLLFAMVFAISLFAAFQVVVFADFFDMSGNSAEQVVTRWSEAGLVSGYPDGTFKPDEPTTRAQFAKIISDLFVLDDNDAEFQDVSSDAWYYSYVKKASKYMCSSETEERGNLFMPEQPITMSEALNALSLLTSKEQSHKVSLNEYVTRAELILLIDDILGGKTGFDYMVSVIDSHKAEESEILPLVTLTEDSDMVTWNEKGQVLLLSWHSYPQSYIPGEQFTCKYGEMWTFTDREVLSWYDKNNDDITDWEHRFEQLLGLPSTDAKTHVSAFWVDPEEIIRPAYQTDVTMQMTPDLLNGSELDDHREWFEGNMKYSYETSAYPWTRLGYTYDWLPDDNEYGLTEFIILADSVIDVEWTKSFEEFLSWMSEN